MSPQPSRRERHIVGKRQPLALPVAQPACSVQQTILLKWFVFSQDQQRMSANLLTLNSSNTEFLSIGLKQQLSRLDNSSLTHSFCTQPWFFVFDENLTFSDQISSLCKSRYSDIRELRCIRPYLDSKTASTIAASIVHSEFDYCKSLHY